MVLSIEFTTTVYLMREYDRSEAVVKVLEKYEELAKFEDKD